MSQKFCNILVHFSLRRACHVIEAVQAMVEGMLQRLRSIMVCGALTRCALLLSVCYFKATQMNVQRREIVLYEFKLGDNVTETTTKKQLSIELPRSEKSGKHLRVTSGNTGLLFRPY